MNVPQSDALVFFGATGDLVFKKIFPALYAMERRGHLHVPVIGVARSKWTIEQFRSRARASVEKKDGFDEAVFARLQQRLDYISGDYGALSTHAALREKLAGAARLRIDSPRWDGVPFFIRAGKCLSTSMTEVLVLLKRPALSTLCQGQANYVRFRLSPDVTIAIGARVKRPGEQLIGDPTELKVITYPRGDELDAYERLLGDAMAGDGTLFAGQDGVEAAWAVVQPILGVVTPVHEYEPGTWGPVEAEKLTAGICGCDSPVWLLPTSKDEYQQHE